MDFLSQYLRKYQYDVAIIDGDIYLRRNLKAFEKEWKLDVMNGKRPHDPQMLGFKEGLIKSFLQSIIKLQKEIDFKRPIIVFDHKPYIKAEGMEDYKGNRDTPSDKDLEGLDPDSREYMDKAHDNEAWKQYVEARSEIVECLTDKGFPSLRIRGYEADDLGYYLSKIFDNREEKVILLSWDSDWLSFVTKKIPLFNSKINTLNLGRLKKLERHQKSLSYLKSIEYSQDNVGQTQKKADMIRYEIDLEALQEEIKEKYRDPMSTYQGEIVEGIPNYHSGILTEIYGNSHNNVKAWYDKKNPLRKDVTLKEFIKRVYEKDITLDGYEEVSFFYQSMDMNKHFKAIKNLLEPHVLNKIPVDEKGLYSYLEKFKLEYSLTGLQEYFLGAI